MRFSNKWAIALLAAGIPALTYCLADDSTPDKPTASRNQDLTVHEWGTFSTFSGSDGTNLKFYPYDNDLPDFVHGYQRFQSKSGPRGGTISLETPVLYFYSERALTASVRVEFPKGILTEWYPHADRKDHELSWPGIKVLPAGRVKLPNEEKKSRYYAARETDANPLRVAFKPDDQDQEQNPGLEQEKFLFYRGVGDFDLPMTVRALGEGKFSVDWDGKAPGCDLILVQVQAGKVRFRPFHLDRPSRGESHSDVRIPDADATPEQLGAALVKLLTDRGLYEKEARAMVKTWRSAWFGEEGTRVLYILPDELTDELLPLNVEPKPAALLRVLVGRHDVLTPERERQIDASVKQLVRSTPAQDAAQRIAEAEMAKLGRYRDAAWSESEARLNKNKR